MITFDEAAKNLAEVGKYVGMTLEQAGKNITANITPPPPPSPSNR